ncbi:hypothetical protein OIO90_002030 [Microbotryomycetes sp. JL221]|nr:hypothetical protein OIO90_002030 [Microbotryomycetes sp. JL221]
MVKAKLECFCNSTVSPQDPKGTTSSTWCTLLCGHIYHFSCMQEWARTSSNQRYWECPYRCAPIHLSQKEGRQRRPHPGYIRLWFKEDVKSDPFDSSQWSDPVREQAAQKQVSVGDYGARLFGLSSGNRRDTGRQAEGTANAGSNDDGELSEVDEVDQEADDAQITPRNRPRNDEVRRLRAELREAQMLVRESRRLKDRVTELEAALEEVQTRNDDLLAQLEQADMSEDHQALEDRLETALGDLEGLRIELDDARAARREAETTMHEKQLKAAETIRTLEAKVKDAGEDGARKRKEMEQEIGELQNQLMRERAKIDKVELTARQKINKARDEAQDEKNKAYEALAAAVASSKVAEDEARNAREETVRIRAANASWTIKYDRLKVKYDKLKSRRQAISDDEDEGADEFNEPLSRKRPRPPVSPAQKHSTPPRALDLSPDRFSFKVRASTSNAAAQASCTSQASNVISLVSSDDDMDSHVPVVKIASSKKPLWRTASSTSSKPARVSVENDLDMLPTLRAASDLGGSLWKKTQERALTNHASDRHLPDFASGLSLGGPKSKLKAGSKR